MKNNLHEELHVLVEKMIEKMEDGTGTWLKSWSAPHGFPKNFTTKKEYRGFNFFYLSDVMLERGYTAPYFLTFNQIKQLEGKVKKGSKSIPVYFYKMLNVTDKETLEEKTIPLLKRYRVFNIEDTDLEYELDQTPLNNNERYQNVEEFVMETEAKIRYGGSRAFFSPSDDYIQIPKLEYFTDSDNYYSTLLHELTHWSGATTRLDRLKKGSMGSKNYAFEELVAELGSVFLCSHLGINIEKNQHPEYLQSWINSLKENPQILWQAASKAQQSFDYIKKLVENSYQEVA
jgi:antirestriction protein ArdC